MTLEGQKNHYNTKLLRVRLSINLRNNIIAYYVRRVTEATSLHSYIGVLEPERTKSLMYKFSDNGWVHF